MTSSGIILFMVVFSAVFAVINLLAYLNKGKTWSLVVGVVCLLAMCVHLILFLKSIHF